MYVSYSTGSRTETVFESSQLVISTLPSAINFNQFPIAFGKTDNVGATVFIFAAVGVYISHFETRSNFSPFKLAIADFGWNQGYYGFNLYPRMIGDLNGDGLDDILGAKSDGYYVSYSDGKGGFLASQLYFNADMTSAKGWFTFDKYPRLLGITKSGTGQHASIVGFGGFLKFCEIKFML